MPYSSIDDLRDLMTDGDLVALTDDANTGVVDAVRAAKAIDDADALIDGYLDKRYTLPLSTVPTVITSISADIANYNLHSRRPGAMNDVIVERNKGAIRLLSDIAKGIVTIGATAAAQQSNQVSPGLVSGNRRVFDRENLEGML